MKLIPTKSNLPACLLAITFCAALAPNLAQAKLYKWVDENGTVQYGDRIPPQYAKQEQKTLNEQGITVEVKERAKTADERAEIRLQEQLKEEEEQRRKEQVQQDRILLDTFSNEDEMVMTRNGKVDAINAIIRVTNGRIDSLRNRLSEQTTEAATLERSGKPVPEDLHKQITNTRQQIQSNLDYISQKEQEQRDLNTRFEVEIQRFRELVRLREEAKKEAEAHAGGY